jgi:hypothetical protein
LAEAYRVFNERALLPAIVDMIVTSARLQVERTASAKFLPSDENNGGPASNDNAMKDLHQTKLISEPDQPAVHQADDDALKQIFEAIQGGSNRNSPR